MNAKTSSASTSPVADIFRLITPADRESYFAMLAHELRGHELPDDELRRVAVGTWHRYLKYGWPRT